MTKCAIILRDFGVSHLNLFVSRSIDQYLQQDPTRCVQIHLRNSDNNVLHALCQILDISMLDRSVHTLVVTDLDGCRWAMDHTIANHVLYYIFDPKELLEHQGMTFAQVSQLLSYQKLQLVTRNQFYANMIGMQFGVPIARTCMDFDLQSLLGYIDENKRGSKANPAE